MRLIIFNTTAIELIVRGALAGDFRLSHLRVPLLLSPGLRRGEFQLHSRIPFRDRDTTNPTVT